MVCAHFIHGIVIGILGEARGDFVLYKKSALYLSAITKLRDLRDPRDLRDQHYFDK